MAEFDLTVACYCPVKTKGENTQDLKFITALTDKTYLKNGGTFS